MPGIVVFRRRWSVGSDDLVVPAIFLLVLHGAWLVVLAVIRGVVHFDTSAACTKDLALHVLGYICLLAVCFLLELVIAVVSLRGSILDVQPRASMQYLLYARLVVLLVEVSWLVVGVIWAFQHYDDCRPVAAKKALLCVIISNWLVVLSVVISLWCTFDSAGRKWVKMKKFQDSLKEKKRVYRRTSGSHRRNWRQRKAFRAYEESWDRRLQLLCCCVERKGRNQNSMTEIAQLFTEFFRDLDVVPTDVVAGLVLMRKFQKARMGMVVSQPSNDVYQYLSGVAITPQTQFLQLSQTEVLARYRLVVHYMYYALAAYGWPLYVMMNTGTWFCRLIPSLRCCCCCGKLPGGTEVIEDNCCMCNYAALKRISQLSDSELVYATYHVDIGETPFYVALDHKHRKVVVCVRGTLSLQPVHNLTRIMNLEACRWFQDVLTDLQAEPESLPLHPPREEWLAHKGMVQAAVYIKKKLEEDGILERAFERDPEKQTQTYDLILVGHSLGAGTASILAILLQPDYPTLHCYAYSPPGGLLSMACCEETKEFITSVVVGKDVVPRIGLPQMEILRTDLINVIKGSTDPKWRIISQGLCCCGEPRTPTNALHQRDVTAHPSDSGIGLSAHTPLYPPGKIIHIVRSHPKENKSLCRGSKPVYQAVWANNADFDEVLISPTMINDHMPDNVLEALEKVLVKAGPTKPSRRLTETERKALLGQASGPSPPAPSPTRDPLLAPESSSPVQSPLLPQGADAFLQISFADDSCPADAPAEAAVGRGEGGGWLVAAQAHGATLGSARPAEWEAGEGGSGGGDEEGEGWARPEQLALPCEGGDWVTAPLASPETLSLASTAGPGSLAGGVGGSQAGSVEGWRRSLASSQGSPGDQGGGGPGWQPDVTALATIQQSPELLHRHPDAAGSVGQIAGGSRLDDALRPGEAESSRSLNGGRPPGGGSSDSGMEEGACSVTVAMDTSEQPPGRGPGLLVENGPGGNSDSLGGSSASPSVSSPGLALDGFNGDSTWHRHSPVDSTQFEYAHPNVHYTSAGLGYPHGAYEPLSEQLDTETSCLLESDDHVLESLDDLGVSVEGNGILAEVGMRNDVGVEVSAPNDVKKDTEEEEDEEEEEEEDEEEGRGEMDPLWTPRSLGDILAECSKVTGMRRSHERMDIAHLQDDCEVFEGRMGGGKMVRGRLLATLGTPQPSVTAPLTDPLREGRIPSNRTEDMFEGLPDTLV